MKKINPVASKRIIRGQGMTEYIIIVALIAIAAIGVFTAFGGTIRSQVSGMAQELAGVDAANELGNAVGQADDATLEGAKSKGLSSYNANVGVGAQ